MIVAVCSGIHFLRSPRGSPDVRPAALLLCAITLLAAACSTPANPASPSASATPSAPAAPTVAESASAAGSAPPEVTPAPSSTAGPATPVPSMTTDETALVAHLRADAATSCAPRRANLPEGAQVGVECQPADPLVARVGIYWFASRNEAAHAYMTRMASYQVDANEGDCNRGVPGDVAWTPGDGEGNISDPGVFNWQNSVLSPNREGCFLDENGTANVRATCDQAYVGVLGRGTDLKALHDWIWVYPDGYEVGTPDAPGICKGPAILTLP
jgi:hypothetical protein